MKYLFVTLASVLAAFTMTACSDDTTTAPDDTQGSSMKATVDGQAWTALTAAAAKQSSGGISVTVVTGAAADGSGISLSIYNLNGTGDYTLGLANTGIYTSNSVVYSTALTPSSNGTVKVTALDATHIAGSFSFTAKSDPDAGLPKTVTVTSGTFNAKF